ncbi:MAG TPA: helix-turn-helix transcriptional regulator [Microbacteriaceae bacterium]|nr:helix-turn-helix transcriptional regulator [Microbacteriaceae bacterium]
MHTTPEPTATIGRRIATARKAKSLTQQDLADEVGVTFQAVSKWETDASLPDVALLAPIATALDLGLDELLTGRKPEPSPDAPAEPRAQWGRIMGEVTKDIHGDVDSVLGNVRADIYGDVNGDIVGEVRSVYGNVLGNIVGEVHGDVTGYVKGKLIGIVYGRVKGGVRGKIYGPILGGGINVDLYDDGRGRVRPARNRQNGGRDRA